MPVAFVIRPFNVKKDSAGAQLDFDRVYKDLIMPALQECGFPGGDMGEIITPGNIREDMFAKIVEAELVICDVSIHNANVFYELGIRHALRKKRTILIKGGPTADSTPFDLLTDRYVTYDLVKPESSVANLVKVIKAARASDATDSPVLNLLEDLPEVDPQTIQAVPPAFLEELGRARAAVSKGWLRLLAHDVEGLRFERPARQLLAEALWKAGDLDEARKILDEIRKLEPEDVPANLALANVFERLSRKESRKEKKAELLKASDQAIERVLKNDAAKLDNRVEALALRGRNQKTGWRTEFEDVKEQAELRAAAMNQALRDSYEAYRNAFVVNLNHFWSGLAALQMGVIFLDLSGDPTIEWKDSFASDSEAIAYRQKVEADVARLHVLVSAAADAALQRPGESENNRLWAAITKPDLLFLSDDNVRRITASYKAVLPTNDLFTWKAAVGQLELFAALGVRGQLASKIVLELQRQQPEQKGDKPLHVVIFAGHGVDQPGRPQPRLPSASLVRAQEAIEQRLRPLIETHKIIGLASALPGADILFHETCNKLDLESTICLPMPKDDYLAKVFDDLHWRQRFLKLLDDRKDNKLPAVCQLSDGPGLPSWLHGATTNEWERGNRWLLEMGATYGAQRVTLLVLWDGRPGDAPGGTADMVKIARNKPDVNIEQIDATALSETMGI